MNIQNTPSVHFSTLNTSRDNAIQNWHEMDWYQLRDLLLDQRHVVTENKDVTMISPWKYKTKDDDFIPRTTEDGQPWLIDDQPVVGRLAANVIGTSMLFFDFDGDFTIGQAKFFFGQWTHLGYTSFSHRSLKKEGKDCFRVVVPLKQFITTEQLVERRKAIYASIPGLDTSCLSLSRSFYVPSVQPNRKHLVEMWDNDGEWFDALDYDPEVYVPPIHVTTVERPVDRQRFIDALKQVTLNAEPEWFKVACAMVANDFTLDDFCEVTIGHLMQTKDRRKCEEKWRYAARATERGRSPTVGYLVNLCKKHGAWTPAEPKRTTQAEADVINRRLLTLKTKLKELS